MSNACKTWTTCIREDHHINTLTPINFNARWTTSADAIGNSSTSSSYVHALNRVDLQLTKVMRYRHLLVITAQTNRWQVRSSHFPLSLVIVIGVISRPIFLLFIDTDQRRLFFVRYLSSNARISIGSRHVQ